MKTTNSIIAKAILISCIAAGFSACTSLPKTAEGIEQLTVEKRFDDAMTAYENLSEEEQANVDLDKIKQARKKYEDSALLDVAIYTKRQQFRKANSALDTVTENIPSSKKLEQQTQRLNETQQQFFTQQTLNYQKALANFYIAEQPILEKLFQVNTEDNKAYLTLYEQRPDERQALSETLGNEGLNQLKTNKKSAEELLKLASALKTDSRWEKGLASIAKAHKKKKAVIRKKQVKKQQTQFQKLQKQYLAIEKNKQWTKAQPLLNDINALKLNKTDQAWYNKKQKSFNNTKAALVNNSLQRGQMLYSKGRIADALKKWREAYAVAPNNSQLKENIDRAQKFQNKFNALNKKNK